MEADRASTYRQENGRPNSLLLAAPREILIHILRYLDTDTLLLVDSLCKDLRTLAREAYPSPDYLLNQLHNDAYYWSDEDISSSAANGLLALQRSSNRDTDAWNEAVATALMAQGRYSEAEVFYKQLAESRGSLPEHTLLTGARWTWPFTKLLSLPVATSRLFWEKACIGAALRGNISMLSDFRAYQISLDIVVGDHCPASAAASMGHVHVLEFLQENGVDLTRLRPSALSEAVSNCRYKAAQFLLEAGAQPDVPFDRSPSDIAIDKGDVTFLRLFAQHTSMNTFAGTSSVIQGICENRLFLRYKRELLRRNGISESCG